MADARVGKKQKVNRSPLTHQNDLDGLFHVFYKAKQAEGMAPKTLENYKSYYTYFCNYMDSECLPRSSEVITVNVIRNYMNYLLSEKIQFEEHKFKPKSSRVCGLSPTTVNDRIKILRTMFNFLENENYITSNPFKQVKKVKEVEKEIVVMSEAQVKQLLKTPNQRSYAGFRDYVLMNTLIDGFFRIGEALRIRTGDISFDSGTVVIRGKSAKSRRSRIVPLSKSTLNLLRELIAEIKEFNTDYIFSSNHGEPLTVNQARHRIKKHAKDTGLKINIYPHLFRHTAATIFLENGGDIRHLQNILGHADLRMVEKYTHLSTKSIKNQHTLYSPVNNLLNNLNMKRKIMR